MRIAAICLNILLCGCDNRQTFDQHYNETTNEIENRAAQIETDLNSTQTESETVTATVPSA